MLSLTESEFFPILFIEYIYTPPSERTEEEKKRIKYASIKKREKLKKTQPVVKIGGR